MPNSAPVQLIKIEVPSHITSVTFKCFFNLSKNIADENIEILPEETYAAYCTAKICTLYQESLNNVTTSY